jgi:hypothetical protein
MFLDQPQTTAVGVSLTPGGAERLGSLGSDWGHMRAFYLWQHARVR